MDLRERFEVKYDRLHPDECWPWLAAKDQDGYGMFWVAPRTVHASRVAWQLANGCPVPDALIVRHTCDTPCCVNPAHLLLGTHEDNARDRIERGRSATGDRNGSRLYPERLKRGYQPGPCRNGHPESKRYVSASGESRCTECARVKEARKRARRRESASC